MTKNHKKRMREDERYRFHAVRVGYLAEGGAARFKLEHCECRDYFNRSMDKILHRITGSTRPHLTAYTPLLRTSPVFRCDTFMCPAHEQCFEQLGLPLNCSRTAKPVGDRQVEACVLCRISGERCPFKALEQTKRPNFVGGPYGP